MQIQHRCKFSTFDQSFKGTVLRDFPPFLFSKTKLFLGPILYNPPTLAELFYLRFSYNLDVINSRKISTLYFVFFQQINDYKEKKYIFFFMLFSYFWFNFIVLSIILKLRPPQTHSFLKCLNILSGSRDI